jgi:hypothetical protein
VSQSESTGAAAATATGAAPTYPAMPSASTPAMPSASTPDDRATSFQAVKGEPEHYSGETLLVSAYAVLWVIVLLWVALVWRKQAALALRLDDLERVIGDAAKKRGPAP